MPNTSAYYSVIQYCPDRSRAEAANLGVLLFVPSGGYLRARLSAGNDRVRRFFEGTDIKSINASKRSFLARVDRASSEIMSVADLEHFIASRANDFLLTPPRPMRISADYDTELGTLYRELVGGRQVEHKRQEKKLKYQLDSAFHSPRLANRIQFDHAVKLPVLGRELIVPYAYKNGALNLVKPQIFPVSENRATRVASELAIDGDLLGRQPDTDGTERRLIVVASFPASLGGAASGIKDLLTTYRVRVVLSDRVDEFVDEVEHEAHG